MDNDFNNTQDTQDNQNEYTYSDPNASYYQNQQNMGQDNYNYNVGNNTGYQQPYDSGMDPSPMSMGDWLLTILALMIPCAGIILYFVWAFGKNGNVNRRNYCRAMLIVSGVLFVIYIVIAVVFSASILATYGF